MSTAPTLRRAATLALSATALALTVACSGGGTATATDTVTSSTTTTTTTTSPAPSAAATSASPATVPAGAGTATTVDLDGDGAPDTLWLADVDGTRELGVRTATGGSSVEFTSAAPQAASASAAVLASRAPVVLLDTGRSVQVYVYRAESGLGPVRGVEGQQYSFSLGFTGYGTGLVCEPEADGLHLYGENATSDDADLFTVTRTEVTVSAEHSTATNGDTQTLGAGLSADDPLVQAAHGTTCGDGGVASEPA
ncbi:hypothetical protein [Kineococcus sp. SYSU DK003]|uniref:hypothetical protein n=1 Tax=Kineococcus sp. SYSU DK003 TaxID=3383124 RepID=UPI003D7DF6F6